MIIVTPTVVDPLSDTAQPAQPEMPIKTLDVSGFDQGLGKNLNQQPTAPAINPDYPPFGGDQAPKPPAPPATAPAAAPPGDAGTGEEKPAAEPQRTVAPPAPATASNQPSVDVDRVVSRAYATSAEQHASAGKRKDSPVKPEQTPGHGSMVEIVTLSHESDADAMVAALKRQGYNPVVNRTPQDSKLHLDVGPFADRKDAEAMRQRLVSDGFDAVIR